MNDFERDEWLNHVPGNERDDAWWTAFTRGCRRWYIPDLEMDEAAREFEDEHQRWLRSQDKEKT